MIEHVSYTETLGRCPDIAKVVETGTEPRYALIRPDGSVVMVDNEYWPLEHARVEWRIGS